MKDYSGIDFKNLNKPYSNGLDKMIQRLKYKKWRFVGPFSKFIWEEDYQKLSKFRKILVNLLGI